MTASTEVMEFQAAELCPSCHKPAYIVARGRIDTRSATLSAKIAEIRHVTPTGSNNCAGIA